MNGYRVLQDAIRDRLAEEYPVPSDHPAGFRQTVVPFDERAAWDAIAVHEYDVVAARSCDGLVGDRRGSESSIGMPDVVEWNRKRIGDLPNEVRGLSRGAIVGDDHFKGSVCLIGQTAQGGSQRIRSVVGRDDD